MSHGSASLPEPGDRGADQDLRRADCKAGQGRLSSPPQRSAPGCFSPTFEHFALLLPPERPCRKHSVAAAPPGVRAAIPTCCHCPHVLHLTAPRHTWCVVEGALLGAPFPTRHGEAQSSSRSLGLALLSPIPLQHCIIREANKAGLYKGRSRQRFHAGCLLLFGGGYLLVSPGEVLRLRLLPSPRTDSPEVSDKGNKRCWTVSYLA